MKRLTGRTDIGDPLLDEIAFINPDDAEGLYNLREIAQHGSDELLYEIANRLAEYEDTGLEPEKIVFLKNIVADAFSDKPEFTEHIRELLRTEKDGRLVVLPCKVGDTIYRCGDPIKKIYEWQIAYVEVYEDETVFVDDSDNTFVEADIGKTVFLTREEAEKALEGNNGQKR